jgi:hypothetical protein
VVETKTTGKLDRADIEAAFARRTLEMAFKKLTETHDKMDKENG